MSKVHKMLIEEVSKTLECQPDAPQWDQKRHAASAAIAADHLRQVRERLEAETARLQAMKTAATAPEVCGPALTIAPARGAVRVFTPVGHTPKGADKWEATPSGFAGRAVTATMDVFDKMLALADRQGRPAPLTHGQISAGRHYCDLVHRHDASGLSLSGFDATTRGGSDRGVSEAQLTDAREIAALRRRIGTGTAMAVRRIRPSARGEAARLISDRELVDMVVLGGCALASVLARHGWSKKTDHLGALRVALAAALDRMQGYR